MPAMMNTTMMTTFRLTIAVFSPAVSRMPT